MKITGAAGTGKTVAMMHRAAHLAKKLTDAEKKVLFTTFTINLSSNVKRQLELLDQNAAERIDVVHLNALARTICRREGWDGKIQPVDELDDLWTEVFKDEFPELLEKIRMQTPDEKYKRHGQAIAAASLPVI
jgi:superfamily I DNA/RNA helicase